MRHRHRYRCHLLLHNDRVYAKHDFWPFSMWRCYVKPRPNDRNMPTQHVATLLGTTCCVRLATVLRHVGCCWLKFETGQIWANNSQHVATCRNTVAKRMQHVAPNNVATRCVMLRWYVAIVWLGLNNGLNLQRFVWGKRLKSVLAKILIFLR